MQLKYKQGDIISAAYAGEFDILVHNANCFCTMGKGIAAQLKHEWPAVYEADLETKKGDQCKLGTCSFARLLHPNVLVVNAYMQYTYWDPDRMFSLPALKSSLDIIRQVGLGRRIAMPRIGAGYARGAWHIIEPIIERKLHDCDVTIYVLD